MKWRPGSALAFNARRRAGDLRDAGDRASRVILLLVYIVRALLLVPSSFAQAVGADPQTTGKDHRPSSTRSGGWVVAAYLGSARTASSALRISQPALNTDLIFEGVRFYGRSFDPPLYYGVRGGYFIPKLSFLGIEAEFIHMKVYSDPRQRVRAMGIYRGVLLERELTLGEIVQNYSISHGANLLLFNLAARWCIRPSRDDRRSRVILATRFGVGPTIPHTESTIEGKQQEQYEWGRAAWQWAAGAELRLWRGLYILGEYKFTRTRQRGTIFAGFAQSLLRSHHGVFGLSYHF
ncbi:MAG: hypothetical protein N0A16_09985 [Blastocatellia bacterium]|nr:hypothetical protein [Blastocatellia bacterium]MCS7158045.1 hypothetical protein [Blastocatellia bacterium]MCX7752552.1 hypothetical protein [Blastocatellia bacterium]MDW8167332.1 hypothetical protein [Acidobacteriota bacterium]MDW8257342.1 hypothetical protein [Acidobacteriota bacterium]